MNAQFYKKTLKKLKVSINSLKHVKTEWNYIMSINYHFEFLLKLSTIINVWVKAKNKIDLVENRCAVNLSVFIGFFHATFCQGNFRKIIPLCIYYSSLLETFLNVKDQSFLFPQAQQKKKNYIQNHYIFRSAQNLKSGSQS